MIINTRLWKLQFKKWIKSEKAATFIAFIRLLPWVLLIGGMKMYVIMLLINTRIDINNEIDQQYLDLDDETITNSNNNNDNNINIGNDIINRNSGNNINDKIHDLIDEKLIQKQLELDEKYRIYSELNTTEIYSSSKNRTPESTIWLFFNRIPRTGGQTVVSLLKYLSDEFSFNHQEHIYRTPWQRLMTGEEQKNLATWFEYNIWPRSYDRFAMYINFTKIKSSYEKNTPAYITMVRDPVEKFLSHYRFKRFDNTRVKLEMALRDRQEPGSGRRWYWRKLESCIIENDPECEIKEGEENFLSSIPFICGQQQQCLVSNSRWALQQAKFNAEYEYSVIGVLEQWNQTLSVLQEYLPMFFTGAVQRYWDKNYEHRIENKSPTKSPISDKARTILKNKFALEYELYEFLLQRLHKQYESITDRLAGVSTLPPRNSVVTEEWSSWKRLQVQLLNNKNNAN